MGVREGVCCLHLYSVCTHTLMLPHISSTTRRCGLRVTGYSRFIFMLIVLISTLQDNTISRAGKPTRTPHIMYDIGYNIC